MKFVGDRLLRKEDPRLLTGGGRYVGDLVLPGMLEVVLVRSPHAHARVAAIDAAAARARPGVVDVVTAADLGPAGRAFPCVPLEPDCRARNFAMLAGERARFVGEAVAAVVAESRYAAEDARELVAVQWGVLPSVQDPVAPGAALVHDDAPDNLVGEVAFATGDVADALARAPHVATARYRVTRGTALPMEPRGVVAQWAGELLTVWTASQAPHQVRQFIVEVLGLPAHRVRVIAPDVGGAFGGKLIVYPEDLLVPFLARRLGRPVRWLESRLENFQTATQERLQVHEVTVGFDDAGRILALRDHFTHDNGAYTPRGLIVPRLTAATLSGPYAIPAIEVRARSVFTNRTPVTPYRGAGQPHAVFALERTLDLVARLTGQDRAAVRRANLVPPERMPYDTGLPHYRDPVTVVYDSGDYPAVLRGALDLARYEALVAECAAARGAGRRRGVGLACYVEMTGVGPFEGASVRLDATGGAVVLCGLASQGQGHETVFAQVAADELGLTPDQVTVVGGDTAGVGLGIGTFASRAAAVGGSAVALAARDVLAKARRLAAHALGAPEADLEQDGPAFRLRADPARRIAFAALVPLASGRGHGADPGLEATRYFEPSGTAYACGAHVALVEVDADTGRVALLGYWVSHDCGRVINPLIVEGQVHGAVAMGIGNALLEEIVYDESGQLVTASLMDYAVPTAADVPPLLMEHLETPSPTNPLGVKGVGESGTLPVAAAVAAAVEDALGVPVTEAPLTRARVAALARGAAPAR